MSPRFLIVECIYDLIPIDFLQTLAKDESNS